MPTTVHTYTGDGVLTDFTISFSFLDESYVTFKVEDTALADVTSNYTGSMFDANTFRFTVPIPSGFRVTFTRDTQLTDDLFSFATGAVIRPNDLGDSMKTLRDYTEEKHDQTANVTINIANDAITTATQTAATKASEAAASETAAAGSASAASTSASNAATSETNAGTSETNAAASATAAATSETNAGTSASNAATSETNAATSATNAATSETNAATSATNAGTSATNAATSQTAAEAARDVVRDVILGQFADDAAVDTYLSGVSYTKDAGDLYFNTTDGRLKVYTGSAWVDVANTTSSDAAATSATAAQAAQTAAEAALNTFVSSYLGSYASDSAVNTAKASVLTAGDIYFNTTDTVLKYYNGSSWNPAAAAQVLNTSSLGNVGDVDYTSAPQSGDYLRRNASNQWERRAVADVKSDLNLPTDAASDISANAAAITTIQGHNTSTALQPNTNIAVKDVTIDSTANYATGIQINKDDTNGTYIEAVYETTGGSNRTYRLRPPATDSLTDAFRWQTFNAHSFEVDDVERLRIDSNGQIVLPEYTGASTHTGTSAKSLAVDSSGNVIEEQDVSSAATPEFAGADFSGNIKYSSNYSTLSALPNASTYHGMFAHTHDTGKPYFSHAGNWIELAQQSAVIGNVADDTTPQLGGNLDVDGNQIVSTSNGNISLQPNGSGKVVLGPLSMPTADGTADQVLKTDGSGNLSFGAASGGGGGAPALLFDSTDTSTNEWLQIVYGGSYWGGADSQTISIPTGATRAYIWAIGAGGSGGGTDGGDTSSLIVGGQGGGGSVGMTKIPDLDLMTNLTGIYCEVENGGTARARVLSSSGALLAQGNPGGNAPLNNSANLSIGVSGTAGLNATGKNVVHNGSGGWTITNANTNRPQPHLFNWQGNGRWRPDITEQVDDGGTNYTTMTQNTSVTYTYLAPLVGLMSNETISMFLTRNAEYIGPYEGSATNKGRAETHLGMGGYPAISEDSTSTYAGGPGGPGGVVVLFQ